MRSAWCFAKQWQDRRVGFMFNYNHQVVQQGLSCVERFYREWNETSSQESPNSRFDLFKTLLQSVWIRNEDSPILTSASEIYSLSFRISEMKFNWISLSLLHILFPSVKTVECNFLRLRNAKCCEWSQFHFLLTSDKMPISTRPESVYIVIKAKLKMRNIFHAYKSALCSRMDEVHLKGWW